MSRRSNLLTYTRYLLRKWARISESQLPKLSQPGDYRSPGRGTRVFDMHLPPELQLIEIVVNRADSEDRLILLTEYLRDWPAPAKYKYIGVSRSSYYRRLESAEMYVKHAID